jgi:Cdc6-like AAA superfamily ATPase
MFEIVHKKTGMVALDWIDDLQQGDTVRTLYPIIRTVSYDYLRFIYICPLLIIIYSLY